MDLIEGMTVSGEVALSPDETKLAFSDAFGTLHIAFLDSGRTQPVAPWSFMPSWSSDSRHLYYQRPPAFADYFADIHVYDWEAGIDSVLIPASLGIPVGTFEVSTGDDSEVFESGGLWLVTWSR
jgi:hypothetical protein